MTRLDVRPRGLIARAADALIYPLMLIPGITPRGESPQLTKIWNNYPLPKAATEALDTVFVVTLPGDPDAVRRLARWDLRFHLGGWPRYMVLEADARDGWYVGWIKADGSRVSQVPITHRVRMLIGPEETTFFAVRVRDGLQTRVRLVGEGKLGDGGPYGRIPLH